MPSLLEMHSKTLHTILFDLDHILAHKRSRNSLRLEASADVPLAVPPDSETLVNSRSAYLRGNLYLEL